MTGMNRLSESSVVNTNYEGNSPSKNKGISTSSPRRNEVISNNTWSNVFGSSAGKTCDTGPENGRYIHSISYEPEEFVFHSTQLEAECGDSNEELLPDNIERDNDPEVHCPTGQQMQHIPSMCHKEKSALVESPLSGNAVSLNQSKGKERVSKTGSGKSVSVDKDDSHESAESSNSKETRGKGKRAWSYGLETLMESKRMRKSINKNSCSTNHIREHSSFMNWISSLTKGFFRYENVDKHSLGDLGLIPPPVQNTPNNIIQCRMSNGSDHSAAYKGMGFGSIFQALYCPTSGKPMKSVSPDYQEERVDSKKLHFNDRSGGSVKAVPASSIGTDQGNYQFREQPLSAPSIYMRNSPIEEKLKHDMDKCNLCNVGSSSSYFQNGSVSPNEAKDVGELGICESSKFSNLFNKNKAGGFPDTLWITRFLPKVASLTPCEKLTDDHPKFLHHSQNEVIPVRDCSNSDNGHKPSEDQRPDNGGHEYSRSPMDSCDSKKLHKDLETRYNVTPILPPQRLKKMEPMTTIFAKRVDALSHIITSDVQDDVIPESATCFFCGKNGQRITECPCVNVSELGDLMQKMNSNGAADKSSSVCNCCSVHDHSTVTCPYASSGHHCIYQNTCHLNPNNFVSKIKGYGSDNPSMSNYDVGTCGKQDNGLGHVLGAHGVLCREISGTISEVQTSNNLEVFGIMNSNGSALPSYLTEDGYRKNEAKGKQIASTSKKNDQIVGKPVPQIININDKPDKQCLIFGRIRKLRLSRSEIIRWMESSFSHVNPIGFFLRVKIEKWVEDLGGTGYHVACIGGSFGKKMYGYSKSHLPVDIGGLRCLIDCRFISNDDFVEDELKAWWSATLRRGDKLPSEEDLDRKIEEKGKLGL